MDNRELPGSSGLPAARSGVAPYGAGLQVTGDPEGDSPGTLQSVGFWQIVRILRKRKALILVLAFCGALAGVVFRMPQAPFYQAAVAVEVQPLNDEFLYSKDINPNSSGGNMYPELDMATQVRILRTRSLLNRVVAKVSADTSLNIRPPADRFGSWRRALHLPARDTSARDAEVSAAAASVTVTPSRSTRIIEISCTAPDPRLAAAFANTMAAEYIDQSLETRWQSAKHTGEWLGRQLDEMKVRLERSEEQLQSYAAAVNLVVTGDRQKVSVSDEKLRQVQAELSAAEADRVSKQARFEQASTVPADTLAQVLDDATLRTYDVRLAELRREMAELGATLTPAHYKVQKVQAQIAEMEAERKKSRDRIIDRIRNEFHEAQDREKLLDAGYRASAALVSGEAGKLVHYNLLQREVDTNRQLYETLLQKVKEAGISAALRASNIRVVDPALPPEDPSGPNLKAGAVMGMFFGLFGGVGLALFQERVRRSIEAPRDATLCLNVPLLGTIPSCALDRVLRAADSVAADGVGRKRGQPSIADFQGSKSVTAEAFRAVLTSILFTGRRYPAQVVMVSSPGASEGKTTVACNLAMAYAEALRTVLIVDCDMRRPRVHRIFGVPNEGGLARLLSERLSPDDDVFDSRSLFLELQRTGRAGVSVLTSGEAPDGTSNLLHSRRFCQLIEQARRQFDVVLLDTPPMLQFADARIVASVADGALLVVRSGQTLRDAALAARKQLDEDGIPLVGVVLNDWDPKAIGYYGYEYYENSYYAETARADLP